MTPLIKVNNSDLSFRLKLNYNNVYSRLKMLFGKNPCIFADLSTQSQYTTWFAPDDANYESYEDVPDNEKSQVKAALTEAVQKAKKEIAKSAELSPYTEEILGVPDESYIFFRVSPEGEYRFVLAGWGCKLSHTQNEGGGIITGGGGSRGGNLPPWEEGGKDTGDKTDDELTGELDGERTVITDHEGGDKTGTSSRQGKQTREGDQQEKTLSEKDSGGKDAGSKGQNKDEEISGKAGGSSQTNGRSGSNESPKKKEQTVVIKVYNQNSKPVIGEQVAIQTPKGIVKGSTDEQGKVDAGQIPYNSSISVSFPDMPNIAERVFEVEPGVQDYEVHIKKYVKYSPVLFIEDQNGNPVMDYNIKVMCGGKESLLNSGNNGMVQLPTMQEGQKFMVIDSANYANSQEYSVTSDNVKKPYKFTIKHTIKSKVGITVFDKDKKPLEGVAIDVLGGDTPCQQVTDSTGRAEFPPEVFHEGECKLNLYVKGKGNIASKLNYTPSASEYSIQLQGKKPFFYNYWNWMWLIPLAFLIIVGIKLLVDAHYDRKVPTIAEMETGVGLICAVGGYTVDLHVPDITFDGNPAVAYFQYDERTNQIKDLTFNPNEFKPQLWWGTGFLISDDGLIATNKHVADPEVPEDLGLLVKRYLQAQKDEFQKQADILADNLRVLAGYGVMNEKYLETRNALEAMQEQVRIYDKLLNTGSFNPKSYAETRIAFTNTRVENIDDFIPCSQPRAVGDPGSIMEKDLAIIQIKKKQEIPKDAFIFTIPEVDLMEGDIPDNYDVTVLGYNRSIGLQSMDLQEAIKPQATHGKITNRSEKYRVGYDAPTLGGSSGSPVLNNKGQLVAINNSGLGDTQGFNYGIRTKYLKELLDQIEEGKTGGQGESKKQKK